MKKVLIFLMITLVLTILIQPFNVNKYENCINVNNKKMIIENCSKINQYVEFHFIFTPPKTDYHLYKNNYSINNYYIVKYLDKNIMFSLIFLELSLIIIFLAIYFKNKN